MSSATTKEYKTCTIAQSAHPSASSIQINDSPTDFEALSTPDLRNSRRTKHDLAQNAHGFLNGTKVEDLYRVQFAGTSQLSLPPIPISTQHHPTYPAIESPSRPGSSMSFRSPNRLGNGFSETHRPFPAASDLSRAPFQLHALPESVGAFPLASSDTLLRSLVLANARGNPSAELSVVPSFSHIPGFPLARETVGDDNGSVLSSSVGPTRTPNRPRRKPADPQSLPKEHTRIQGLGNFQSKGLSKEYWMPDKDVKECYDCAAAFTSWRRKHHCRICGAIFCSRCASNLVSGHRFASSGYIRVCNICLAKLEPESDDPNNFTAREDTDDDTQSFSEATSGFNILGPRSQGTRPPFTTPSKTRDGFRQAADQLSSSVSHRGGRSLNLPPPDQRPVRHKSALRQPARVDKVKSKLHPRRNSSPTLRPSPISVNRSSPTVNVIQLLPHGTKTVTTAPFRKGLTDEEQTGFPGITASSHTRSVYLSSPSRLPADVGSVSLERDFRSGSHENLSDAAQNDDRPKMLMPSISRTNSVSHPEGHYRLMSELPFSKASASYFSETEPSLAQESSFSDFPTFCCEHVRFMIHQFLERENIEKSPQWEKELTNLLLQLISDPPRPTYDGDDAGDIRKLVKVKKIPGGQIGNCEYIHGVVFTKNVAHKKMKSTCIGPKVLTIAMPLEFQRVDGYCKLDVLVSQERQYLRGLVQRLTSLEPDLVLVGGNVSGIAIDYFVEAGVTVLRHVKTSVLQAVSRSTQTPLISSLDKLLNLQIGQCDLFRVQTVYHRLIPNHQKKNLIRLEGCEPCLGGTLILRGGDWELLSKLKSLMTTMVGVAYSLRLENSFLNAEGATFSNHLPHAHFSEKIKKFDIQNILSRFHRAKEQIFQAQLPHLSNNSDDPASSDSSSLSDLIDDLIMPYEVLSTSGSPRVKLTPPFALLKLRDLSSQLTNLSERNAESSQALSKKLISRIENVDEKLPLPSGDTSEDSNLDRSALSDGLSLKSDEATAKLQPAAVSAGYSGDEYFAYLSRQVDEERMAVNFYLSNHSSETFRADNHQQIIVQESVTCSFLGGSACQGPHLRAFCFYSAGDQSVGQIIQMLIDCRSEVCHAKGCNQPKSIHQTNWIHGHFKATIQIKHQDHSNHQTLSANSQSHFHPDLMEEPDDPSLIIMQGYCPLCNGYTRKIPMSDDAWRLSLGKYLQLCFYSPGLVSTLVPANHGGRLPCNHDSHVDHVRIFYYQGFRVDFRLQKVNVYEAIPPSLVLFTPTQAQIKVREEEYETILKRSEAFFNSVRARIIGFNYDVVSIENQDSSEEAMRDLLQKVEVDLNAVKSQLDDVYTECAGTNGVKMNIVRKTLIGKAVEWDGLFASFESRFVASDKDARRLASVPLKKIFLDQSVPGSPERIFSKSNQPSSLMSYKYNYNSQSEVESDHAPKGQSFGTFKKTFPSPTLKSMASALAFALPSSMPGLGIPDTRSETSNEKSKITSVHPLEPSLPLKSSQPTSTQDDLTMDFHPNLLPPAHKQPSGSKVPPEISVELLIPSVIIEPASTPTSAVSNLKEAERLNERLPAEGQPSDDLGASDAVTASSSSTVKAPIAISDPRQPSLLTSRRPSCDEESQPHLKADADVLDTNDEDSKSDSTIVDFRNDPKSTALQQASVSPRKKREGSDTDTTTSEVEWRNGSRRMTLRSRRPKDLVLNPRGGVANLVQKFESPKPSERQAGRSKSPIPPESSSKPHNLDEDLCHKTLKTTALPVRPSFRRGKSEVVRSSLSVLRGKRPVGAADKGDNNVERNQSFDALSPRTTPKQTSVDSSHKSTFRNQRVASRIVSPRVASSHPHSHRSSVARSSALEMAVPTDQSRIPLSPRAHRFTKEPTAPRRSRPDSGLPISSFYFNRRPNNSAQNRVTAIARHFDRLSREAERARMKQVNEHRSRPRPIAHAKSSVQAFSSLTAAVNEDSDSDIDECEGHPAGHDADDEGDVIPEVYGPENPGQDAFKVEPDLTPDLPLVTEATPAGPHPSPDLDHIDPNYLDDPSSSNLRPSPTRVASCSPSFLTNSARLPPTGISQFSDNDMSSSDTARHSIIKTLSSLWNFRGAEFLPLDYPQLPTEHQSAENPVIIREDEPSSIIAYTLASKLYESTLQETEPRLTERSEIFMPEEFKPRSNDIDSTWGMIDLMPDDLDVDDVLKVPANRAKPMQFRFDVTPCTITCKVFFMHQFEALRKTLIPKNVVESLARCHKWDASGGKSGQKFLKTKDERYLIKGISKAELEALTKFAPAYFEYLSLAMKEKRPITLAKMFGIFQVSFVNKVTNRKGRLQVQVIENLWVTKPHLQIYDLKGLTRNRMVNVTGRPHEVLLDGNFCEMVRTNPVLVRENSLLRLQASLHNDTLFLANNNVMDYSLAVGFDEEKQEMYVGIIDYLQTYSWDKRLETLVKELGGTSKEAPTIITPSLYKARFRRAMGRYFSVAPDPWMHKWKPYLSPTEEDSAGPNPEKDGPKLTETGAKTEDCYVLLSGH